jgi:hypothetical protein
VSLHLHHDRAGLAAQAPLTLTSFSESSLPSSLPWPDSESENFCTHTGAGARVSVRACLPLAMYVSECPRALCGCSDTHTQTRPPDRPPVGFKLGCVGVETCAARGGMGGTFSAPTNILRTAGCACEREQRSASDGLGRAKTQCPAGQSRVRTVGKQAAAERRDEGAPRRGRKNGFAGSCPSAAAAAGRSLEPLQLQK